MNYIHVIEGKEIYMKKKLVLMTSALMAISLLAGCGSQHTHNWGEVVYEWSTDHKSCTATRVCKDDESHKETETKDSVYAVTKEAKCEEDGTGRYTVTFDNEAFGTAHFDITLEQTGHDWGTPTYTWSDDYSSCTATRVCKNDPNHVETETADSAYTEIIPATCDTDGSAVYDVAFEKEFFEAQSHEITLPATGHSWGTPTYTWSDDNSTCTARRVCAHDATHVETETVNSTYKVVEEAKCEEDGKGRYTADFTREAFADQTKDITLEAIGHSLTAHDAHAETCTEAGNSAYWSCERCGKFYSDAEGKNEIENNGWIIPAHAHDLTHHVAVNETCEADGNIEYWTCGECHQYFLDEAGTQLTSAEAIVVKAHHTLEHHAKDPESCTEPGIIEYWHCTVCGNDFYDEAATREVEGEDDLIIPAKHSWDTPTYTWADDNSKCTATSVCKRDSTHKIEETVECTYKVVEVATEEADGKGKYTATFENEEFATQEKEVVIESLPTLSKLTFTSNGDGTYSVKCKDRNITGRVKIPSTYGEGEAEGIVTTLPKQAFFAVPNITEVFIPNTIKTIGNDAFYECEKMTDVHFAENSVLESIGNYAFQDCHSLVSVTLPKSVKTLGEQVFDELNNLESVVFEEGNELESIGDGCFSQCPKLKTIKFAETSKFEELYHTFRYLDALEELDLPNSVESIAMYSIFACSSLKTLWLSKGLKTLAMYCIDTCPIENLHFKGTIEEWNQIEKENNWCSEISTNVVHCTDGDVAI